MSTAKSSNLIFTKPFQEATKRLALDCKLEGALDYEMYNANHLTLKNGKDAYNFTYSSWPSCCGGRICRITGPGTPQLGRFLAFNLERLFGPGKPRTGYIIVQFPAAQRIRLLRALFQWGGTFIAPGVYGFEHDGIKPPAKYEP